ncbi:MAG: type II toxin-antitoxin system prevent-host-death family antitoxin [Pseudomonadota bacterium]
MKVQMNIAEAKAKLSELVARAEAGEEVVIARDGVPAVVLKPANDLQPPASRRLGWLSGPIWEAPDAWDDDEEAERYLGQSFEEDNAADAPDKDER